jgi:hypothetical protein
MAGRLDPVRINKARGGKARINVEEPEIRGPAYA